MKNETQESKAVMMEVADYNGVTPEKRVAVEKMMDELIAAHVEFVDKG